MAGKGVVHFFTDAGGATGFLKAVTEAVEDLAAVVEAALFPVPGSPLGEGARQNAVRVGLQVREQPPTTRCLAAFDVFEEAATEQFRV